MKPLAIRGRSAADPACTAFLVLPIGGNGRVPGDGKEPAGNRAFLSGRIAPGPA
ncbi:hypothetical protein Tmar_1970 [Thermaerobacter marianensis DSM 12885]|uniref:Uncharacterized protein n=1 Tax=Thermaerobacter marianensis (strain ATCC 700841 / DSM 12885 / JCM 10246 / 7p75a) TaxID=644966 RepID=E6SJ29_THEM7|nr:hypothetical protein Tmar_1970 [Thermaerobacter marianensis DSM 12885]